MSKLLGGIKLVLSIDCKRAMRTMSEGMDRNLTGWERAALRAHLLICGACRRGRRQLAFLRDAVRGVAVDEAEDAGEPTAGEALSAEARERIEGAVRARGESVE